MPYANNKGADQPAHPRSLISTFVVRCLDSMICILGISKVSRFYLASVAEQAGLNLTCSKIPEDTFSLDAAHFLLRSHLDLISIVLYLNLKVWITLTGCFIFIATKNLMDGARG